jgi:hypothetical protein
MLMQCCYRQRLGNIFRPDPPAISRCCLSRSVFVAVVDRPSRTRSADDGLSSAPVALTAPSDLDAMDALVNVDAKCVLLTKFSILIYPLVSAQDAFKSRQSHLTKSLYQKGAPAGCLLYGLEARHEKAAGSCPATMRNAASGPCSEEKAGDPT